MIKKYEGYKAVCDICGEEFTVSDCAFIVYDTKIELKDELQMNDWEFKDDKVICESCLMDGKKLQG